MESRPVDRSTSIRYCASCNDEAVYPFSWEEQDDASWYVVARCGNCDTYRSIVMLNEEVEDWDIWLDDTMDEIMRAYKKLMRSNMQAELDSFCKLLEFDLIEPQDFANETNPW